MKQDITYEIKTLIRNGMMIKEIKSINPLDDDTSIYMLVTHAETPFGMQPIEIPAHDAKSIEEVIDNAERYVEEFKNKMASEENDIIIANEMPNIIK